MLVWRAFAITHMQRWRFEHWWVRNWVLLQQVRTCHPNLFQFIPLGQGCYMSLDAFDYFGIDWRWRRLLCIFIIWSPVFFFPLIVCRNFSRYFDLSWVESTYVGCFTRLLLSLKSLLLRLHVTTEIRFIIIINHVSQYKPSSYRADGSERGIATSFFFIIGLLEEVPQWFQGYSPCREKRLSIVVGYCYPGASILEGSLLFHQDLT